MDGTPREPYITRQQLRALHVGRTLYRWFLRRFPQGASYQALHAALLDAGQHTWLESLVDYAYAHNFAAPPFVQQELNSVRGMAASLTHGQVEQLRVTASTTARTGRILTCNRPLHFATGKPGLQISCNGFHSELAVTGQSNIVSQCGNNGSIASAGYACQLIGGGFASHVSNTGQNSRISCLDDRARIANCGNAVKISSAGRGTAIANSGRRNYLVSTGSATRLANSGDSVHIHTGGDNACVTSSGDNAIVHLAGDNSVLCATGSVQCFTLGQGGCAALTYHDGTRLRFITVYEGENGIVAGVAYRVNKRGELVAAQAETEKSRFL